MDRLYKMKYNKPKEDFNMHKECKAG